MAHVSWSLFPCLLLQLLAVATEQLDRNAPMPPEEVKQWVSAFEGLQSYLVVGAPLYSVRLLS